MGIIFAGLLAAFAVLIRRLPAGVSASDALVVAGGFGRLHAVDFSLDVHRRYTFWSGLLGGFFLALSYFGTDQSQVQRYLAGASLKESRLGLMFNAVFKIPMQAFILLLGALVFAFYQFERPPIVFNPAAAAAAVGADSGKLQKLEADFSSIHAQKRLWIGRWLEARHSGDAAAEVAARSEALAQGRRADMVRTQVRSVLLRPGPAGAEANDADYVFIRFVIDHLPHGLVGLLVAMILAAAMSSKSAELNALGSVTTVDLYRNAVRPGADDAHCLAASRWFTALWGLAAIAFALFARLAENLIQAINILGSVFYGVMLGIFLVAFFLKPVRGTAVFWGAIGAQALVFALYAALTISYLWYNLIGCAACVGLSLAIQAGIGFGTREDRHA